MAIGMTDQAPNTHRHGRRTPPGYRLVVMIAYLTFLTAACAARLALWRWSSLGGRGYSYRSVFEEARARTYATVPYAFMY